MTATKTMPGVLEFPSSYQVMDEEEMTYVEGGFYLSKTRCIEIATGAGFFAAATTLGAKALSAYLVAQGTTITAKVIAMSAALGPVGITLTLIGAALLTTQIASFALPVATAVANGSGVEMKWKGVFCNYKYY